VRLMFFIALLFVAHAAHARSYGWIQFFDPKVESEALGNQSGDPVELLTSETTPKTKLQELEKSLSEKGAADSKADPKSKSDLAGVLLLLHGSGASERAISLLREAEKDLPGQYVIAMNAATALELGNFYEEADHWLNEAKSRNPQGYLGSEWLQALIVQAKQQMAADPEWLNEHSVLGEDFGKEDLPLMPKVPDRAQWVSRAKHAIFQQLRGRLRFAEPPDPIIGDLLFDYANLELLTGNSQAAAKLYEMSIHFEPPQRQLAERRLKKLKSVAVGGSSAVRNPTLLLLGFVIAIFVTVLLMGRHFRLKKGRKTDT
jgi:hypothetical protein